MSFLKNLKEATGFQYLKIIEDELIALEDASHIMFAVDEFVNKEKAKKVLNSLTSISLAKAYWHLFVHVDRHNCNCWQCFVREEFLQILLKLKTNRLVLTASYKLIKIPERNTDPFLEEWEIKNDK